MDRLVAAAHHSISHFASLAFREVGYAHTLMKRGFRRGRSEEDWTGRGRRMESRDEEGDGLTGSGA